MCQDPPAPATHTGGAVIEPDTDETDSAFGSDDGRSDLTSLTSSILNYEYKNGRRYSAYKGSKYFLPNDEAECDRSDLIHHIYGMLLGGRLILAPITNPQRIMDVGCGTGIWAIDVADAYPSAEVVGVDISPIQPNWVPPNLKFIIDNVEEEWTYSNKFDLIHFVNMNACITDWPKFLRQCFDNLQPGGFLEAKETDTTSTSDDGTYPDTCALYKLQETIRSAMDKLGMTMHAPANMKRWMQEAGFVDVQEQIFKLPFNAWPKDPEIKQIGRYQLVQYLDALAPYALGTLVDILGWTREEMEVAVAEARKDLKNTKFHGYNTLRVVTGRKPRADE
ncbi:Tam domain methyltransferase protein [Lasiodiplodia theobromae]|uniref:Secondary metabolism regulator LAE1 n=1 Tax=Lasiodiplodia theobromae TaxID=45133 RepID=A0A5N5D022_9PEZI|nr:Tam domain methyltransferase protein [Lasiodiplodia theobromae]KAB2570832.1 Secondary metabolism regulator LAE1 [Lasiodiplodia theobromae]KAF4537491.1 Tam domain methyltransferase protein [Lasiodiplodia theobromae]